MDLKRTARCLRDLANAIDPQASAPLRGTSSAVQPEINPEAIVIGRMPNGQLFGVSEAARRLKVSKGHLSLVINGKRQSKRLMKRVHIKEVK